MTLQEAIEIVTQHQKGINARWLPRFVEAEKLLIEAGKSIQEDRLGTFTILLPGETSE